jgi:hypothetical protein
MVPTHHDDHEEETIMGRLTFTGLITAGLLLTGVAFGIMQGRATAEPPGNGAGRAVESPAQTAPPRFTGCGGGRSRQGAGGCCSASAGSTSAATAPRETAEKATPSLDPSLSPQQRRQVLADFYSRKLGGAVEVEVKDYGCHQEAVISRDGKVVTRLSIRGSQVIEIG